MKKELEKQLVEKGVYLTSLIKELLEILFKENKPLSVEDVLRKFEKKDLFPNKTSLYRQFSKLTNLGILEETIFSDGIRRYCVTCNGDHHHHFECDKCGYIENIPMDVCGGVLGVISKKLNNSGHVLKTHSFIFRGLCFKCSS